MARRSRAADMDEVELELTPMIDVVFLLLIFFMVSFKLKKNEGLIRCFLPKNRGQGQGTPTIDLNEVRIKCLWYDASGAPTKDEDNGFVVLKIGNEPFNNPGELIDDPGQRVFAGKNPLWQELYTKLVAFKEGYKGSSEKGLPVIIDSRKQVPTKYVVLVLNEVVRAGIEDVTFAAPEIEY